MNERQGYRRGPGKSVRPFMRLVKPKPEQKRPYGMRAAGNPPPERRAKAAWRRTAFMAGIGCAGFLLGRAVILDSLTPFILSAYAVSLLMRRGASLWMAAGLFAGAVSGLPYGTHPLVDIAILCAYRLLLAGFGRYERTDIHVVPFLVFAVDAGFRLGFAIPFGQLDWYSAGMAMADGFLAFLLTVMFLQMPPILTSLRPKKPLKLDEVLGLVILLASLLAGLRGLAVGGINIESVMGQYVVLLFALSGGAGLGGATGAIVGALLALGSIGLAPLIGSLGFAGTLAGLLRRAGRAGVSGGFLLAAVALALYTQAPQAVLRGAEETCGALILFALTPKSWLSFLSRQIPGTEPYGATRQEQANRIKELMTARIQEVATVFDQLSASFQEGAALTVEPVNTAGEVIEQVACELCQHCRKYDRCWRDDGPGTWEAMKKTLHAMRDWPDMTVQDVPREFYSRCIKLEHVLPALTRAEGALRREAAIRRYMRESRALVASQLSGVSGIMNDLAAQVRREAGARRTQEGQILEALGRLGLEVQGVDIVSLEEGKVEIDVLEVDPSGHDECAKLVAPVLSDILGETIAVSRTDIARDGSYQRVRLSSARLYDVTPGFASAAKEGSLQSGDSFSLIEVGNGRYAIALSDGMGNGDRASRESSAAIKLVQQLLKAGFDEEVAVRTVNSALLLRTPDEMYATLDLAVIDLYTLRAEILKVGSVTTFIKRGRAVTTLEGESAPMGILHEIDLQTRHVSLREGDMLVFISDGILSGASHMQDPPGWVGRQLERMETDDPQIIADLLLEASARLSGGDLRDDMTVVCARFDRHKPTWATIRLPEVPRLRRRKKADATRDDARRLVNV